MPEAFAYRSSFVLQRVVRYALFYPIQVAHRYLRPYLRIALYPVFSHAKPSSVHRRYKQSDEHYPGYPDPPPPDAAGVPRHVKRHTPLQPRLLAATIGEKTFPQELFVGRAGWARNEAFQAKARDRLLQRIAVRVLGVAPDAIVVEEGRIIGQRCGGISGIRKYARQREAARIKAVEVC